MTYLWRDIDPEVWAKLKIQAATERTTIKALLEGLVLDYLKTRCCSI